MSSETLTPTTDIAVAPPSETAVDPDGWIYDVATGEVLGRLDVTEAFAIDSADAADWVLELRSKIEGEIAGIDARIKALTEQLQAVRREKVRRLSWWDWRFRSPLTAFARKFLEGSKSRTAQFTWGKVAFRKTSGRTEILDMAHAVQFVKTWEPDLVKVKESVGVKDVEQASATASQITGEALGRTLPFLATQGPGEAVTISTGIEVERNKT